MSESWEMWGQAAASQPPGPDRIEQAITFVCVDDRGRLGALDAELAYVSADPFPISITFRAANGDVTWELARDLVQAGLIGPVGEGDVRLWPEADILGRPLLVLELSSPDGSALLQAPAYAVSGFLARTVALVVPGAEAEHLDVDDVVDQLLAGA